MIIGYDDSGNPIDDGTGDFGLGDPYAGSDNMGGWLPGGGISGDPMQGGYGGAPVNLGNGTFYDPSTGQILDQNGQPTNPIDTTPTYNGSPSQNGIAVGGPGGGTGGLQPSPTGTPNLRTVGNQLGSTIAGNLPGLINNAGLTQLGAGALSLAQIPMYQDWANHAAQLADPFASQRPQYQSLLASLYKDPSQIVNTPGYKFALSQGLGAIANQDVNKFGVGAGSTDVDRMNYAEGLAQQTYNSTINNLTQLSGGNFGPNGAAQVQMGGMLASAGAMNNAYNNISGGLNLTQLASNLNNAGQQPAPTTNSSGG